MGRFEEEEFRAFSRFVGFFSSVFSAREDPLASVDCGEALRRYVRRYYAKTFGGEATRRAGPEGLLPRHYKWLLRLQPLLALPRGSTILDYGGGYGLDSIFLASRGYDVVFYEITAGHVAIAQRFRSLFEESFGALSFRAVLGSGRETAAEFSARCGEVDAFLLDEVAHHVEPAAAPFHRAAAVLRPGGRLFLLEPSWFNPLTQAYFFRVRGVKTTLTLHDEKTGEPFLYGNEHIRPLAAWKAIAEGEGFELSRASFIVPWGLRSARGLRSRARRLLGAAPVLRHIAGSHVTAEFVRRAAARSPASATVER